MAARYIEDAFTDEQGRCLLSRSKVSEVTEVLWEQYEAFQNRDLSDLPLLCLFLDGLYEPLRTHGITRESSPRTCSRRSKLKRGFALASWRRISSQPFPLPGKTARRRLSGFEASKVLWDHLKAEGYIDKKGRIQDALREVLKNKTLSVPDEFTAPREQIVEVLRKSAGRLEIKNADERRPVRVRPWRRRAALVEGHFFGSCPRRKCSRRVSSPRSFRS